MSESFLIHYRNTVFIGRYGAFGGTVSYATCHIRFAFHALCRWFQYPYFLTNFDPIIFNAGVIPVTVAPKLCYFVEVIPA